MRRTVQKFYAVMVSLLLTCVLPGFGQVGSVLWEDQFNTLNTNVWVPDIGDGCSIGLCGWGNQELQSYQSENVYIGDVPGEAGNKALVLEAKSQTIGGSSFTSGKVTTSGKLSVKYGLIEVRMRVPAVETGLWPAAWLLGTSTQPWPAKGEIDMMEMGHKAEERTRQGYPGVSANNFVGGNAIFSTADGGYGSIAYDVNYNQPYVPSTSLANRFVTYRLYWEPTQMRFAVVDNGVEYDLYAAPFPLSPDDVTAPFTRPFYMLLNLAVGGNFTDAANAGQMTAPLPAKMYVDYVRISQYNGHGEVDFDYGALQPEIGKFGVYTDNTVVNNEFNFGTDAQIYGWGGTVQAGTTAPYEGSNVIAWQTTTPNSWFGGGVASLYGKNMSGFEENGSLKFRIKIPANVAFRIGLTDNYTNEKFIVFPANVNQYGLVRNGEWGQVTIPIADFSGLLAFQNMGYLFAISSVDGSLPATTFQFAIDDIVWDDGNGTTQTLTSIAVTPTTATITAGGSQQFAAQGFDQSGNPMSASISWSTSGGSVSSSGLFTSSTAGSYTVTASSGSVQGQASITVNPLYTGVALPACLQAESYVRYLDNTTGNTGGAFRTDNVDIQATGDATGAYNVGWIDAGEWLEFDVHSTVSRTLVFGARVASPSGSGRLHVNVDGVNVTGTMVVPNTGGWQTYTTVNSGNITVGAGNHVVRIVFDAAGLNINYLDITAVTVPVLTTVVVSPATATINSGQTQQFSAQGYDQNGNTMSATYTWSASGGSINSSGLYTGGATGTFTVTATSGTKSGTAQITVNASNSWTVPGRVEAENFNSGGEGVGYHDLTAGNTGGAFRTSENVDIEATSDTGGGYNVGWIDATEWLAFAINSTKPSYNILLRVASPSGGTVRVEIDGVNVTGSLTVPATGGWQTYTTITAPAVQISVGTHTMRVYFQTGGYNLNYVELVENVASGCSRQGPNGDYTVSISSASSNPTLTFVPGYAGVGNNIVILYYGTSPTGGYPGYTVTPNNPYTITAAAGQTIYFYYTYSVPEGGERNSSANRHSFVVGNCGSGSRLSEGMESPATARAITLYPNPVEDELTLDFGDQAFSMIEVLDISGKLRKSIGIEGKSTISLQVGDLQTGHYFIRLSGSSGTQIERMIKK